MIEVIFSVDYEIYGNGAGSLRECIYDPMEKLRALFGREGVPIVIFAEAAELEIIEANGTDSGIGAVREQLRKCRAEGFEIALHLHPQWYNGRYENQRWSLDDAQYNLCVLPENQIAGIVDRSIGYLRNALGDTSFTPFTFRAGNWLFQPSATAARVLAERGIKVDSSVFKGGVQRRYALDYRRSLANGHFWQFTSDANVAETHGLMLEIPVYSVMTPFWNMLTAKRVGLQSGVKRTESLKDKAIRLSDYMRPTYPLKFDFCRMTEAEMDRVLGAAIEADARDPGSYRPMVAIGHTKDLIDTASTEYCIAYLKKRGIGIVTFPTAHARCVANA